MFPARAMQLGQCLRKSRGCCGRHEADHEGVVHGIVRLGFAGGVVFLLGDLQPSMSKPSRQDSGVRGPEVGKDQTKKNNETRNGGCIWKKDGRGFSEWDRA